MRIELERESLAAAVGTGRTEYGDLPDRPVHCAPGRWALVALGTLASFSWLFAAGCDFGTYNTRYNQRFDQLRSEEGYREPAP